MRHIARFFIAIGSLFLLVATWIDQKEMQDAIDGWYRQTHE